MQNLFRVLSAWQTTAGSRDGMREMEEIYPTV